MGEAVQLTAGDGFRFDAWHARATDARRGGLVICHAVWGVTPHLRALADDYAAQGYETLVPSLFDRQQRGFAEVDADPSRLDRQRALAEAAEWGAGVLDAVQAAIDDANAVVSQAEAVRKFVILDRDWTQENGYLTPSLKVRRSAILSDFHDVVEALFVR